MLKILLLVLMNLIVAACTSLPIPGGRQSIPITDSLDVEVNVDCLFKVGRTAAHYSHRCRPKEFDKLQDVLRSEYHLKNLSVGDEKFLNKNQLLLLIEFEYIKDPEFSYILPDERSVLIRWRIWNKEGLITNASKVFEYQATRSAYIEELIDWQVLVGDQAYLAMRKSLSDRIEKSDKLLEK